MQYHHCLLQLVQKQSLTRI